MAVLECRRCQDNTASGKTVPPKLDLPANHRSALLLSMQTQSTLPASLPDEHLAIDEGSGDPNARSLLVVEDDELTQRVFDTVAQYHGFKVRLVNSVAAARAQLAEQLFDVVFIDLQLPDSRGEILLDELRQEQPDVRIVIMTAQATIPLAVDLLRRGAIDFLEKPVALEKISSLLESLTHHLRPLLPHHLGENGATTRERQPLDVSNYVPMQKLLRLAARLGSTKTTVLIQGEEGVGKELLARTIHDAGKDREATFVALDCDALFPFQLEALLFGSQALHPLKTTVAGFLNLDNYTVYLSEIGRLGLDLQAKLHRSLSEIGSPTSRTPRTRVIASSSEDLHAMVLSGNFRRDLYYRLNVMRMQISPLRERSSDILPLVNYFLEKRRKETGLPFNLSKEVKAAFCNYTWPGNLAEVQSIIEALTSVTSHPSIMLTDLPPHIQLCFAVTSISEEVIVPDPEPLIPLEVLERREIERAMCLCKGNVNEVARLLGIGRTTLYRKLNLYAASEGAYSE